MESSNILLIESDRASAPSFAPALEKKGYQVTIRHKVKEALRKVDDEAVDLVVLDAASMRTPGTRLARRLRDRLDGTPIILLSPEGTQPQPGSGASLILIHPFTARKLLNRVARMVPGDEKDLMEVGPIKLNMAQRKVRAHGRETRLTPKQAKLLEVFMQNPGRLLTRKTLIQKVWNTDYTGDTRTLDVHISWLRQAIEADRNKPKIIRTIRGMGYRMDLPGKD
ncbi:MAG: winged-helix domain-containing protein [Anaerolineales bacterium]